MSWIRRNWPFVVHGVVITVATAVLAGLFIHAIRETDRVQKAILPKVAAMAPGKVFSWESGDPNVAYFCTTNRWGHSFVVFVTTGLGGLREVQVIEDTPPYGRHDIIKPSEARVATRDPNGVPVTWDMWQDWQRRLKSIQGEALPHK